jgi:predicted DCC family thiol-disulfide oxidoreductase YuxK
MCQPIHQIPFYLIEFYHTFIKIVFINFDIIVDKDCPFCKNYAQLIKLKKSNDITIINARDNILDIKEFAKKGFDINNGVIVVADTLIFQGSDAIIFLQKVTNGKLFLYDNILFKKVLYPIIKFIRRVLLIILGKTPNIKY